MDQEREVGIVLRHYGRYITIFDHKHRRNDVIIYTTSISRGSFISYVITKDREKSVAKDIALEYMPLMQARADIYFLHSLLDICYHFIPEGSIEIPIYSFLLTVLRSFDRLTSVQAQKAVLCFLFARLGFHPSGQQAHAVVDIFARMPIDNVIAGNLELTAEDFLNEWLIWCIEMYPQGKKCKSLPLFLQKR